MLLVVEVLVLLGAAYAGAALRFMDIDAAVSAPYLLILDAKNFLVAPVGLETFVAPDGRARSRREGMGRFFMSANRCSRISCNTGSGPRLAASFAIRIACFCSSIVRSGVPAA